MSTVVYPRSIEATRRLAHRAFERLLDAAGERIGAGVQSLRVDPSYGRGWVVRVACAERRTTIEVVTNSRVPAAFPATPSLGYSPRRPRADGDDAPLAEALCRALAALPVLLPPSLTQAPRERFDRVHRTVVDLPSVCDRGCMQCSTNYVRALDPGAASWAERAPRDGVLARQNAAAEALWPRVADAIRDAATRGGSIAWTGADATASPIFERALDLAAECGLEGMELQTPGTALADPDFVRSIGRRGVSGVNLTAHAASAALFDRIGGRPGAHELFWRAVDNALGHGLHVFVWVPLTAMNAAEVPTLLARLTALPLRVSTYYWHTDPGHEAGYDAMPLSMHEATRVLDRAAGSIAPMEVEVSGFPACAVPLELLDTYVWSIRNSHLDPEVVTHAPSCRTCALVTRCAGVPRGYVARHALPPPLVDAADPRVLLAF